MSGSIKIIVELGKKDPSVDISSGFVESLTCFLRERSQEFLDLWHKDKAVSVSVYPQDGGKNEQQQAQQQVIQPPPPPQIPHPAQSHGPSICFQPQTPLRPPQSENNAPRKPQTPQSSPKEQKRVRFCLDNAEGSPSPARSNASLKRPRVPTRSPPSASNNCKPLEEDYDNNDNVENKLLLCAMYYLVRTTQNESFTRSEIEYGETKIRKVFRELCFADSQITAEMCIAHGDIRETDGKYFLTDKGKEHAEEVGERCAEIEAARREAKDEEANESPRKATKRE